MAQLESLDGKKYNVPDDVLARYKIGAETVGQNMQHHDLPIAPKPQEGWDDYGFDQMPQAAAATAAADDFAARKQPICPRAARREQQLGDQRGTSGGPMNDASDAPLKSNPMHPQGPSGSGGMSRPNGSSPPNGSPPPNGPPPGARNMPPPSGAMSGPGGPDGEMPAPRLSGDLIAYFWRFVKPDSGRLVLCSIGLIIHAAITVGMAFVPYIISTFWSNDTRRLLLTLLAGLLVVSLAVLLLQLGVSWMITGISENVLRRVRLAIFDKIGLLPSEDMSFQSVGKFAQRTTGDVMRVGSLVTPGIPQLLLSSLQLVFMTGVLLYFNPQFGWLFPVSVIIIWIIVRRVNERVRYWARKDQLMYEDIMTHFIEAIGGCRDLVASGRFGHSVTAYDKELATKQRFVISASIWNSLTGLIPMGIFAMLSFGYYLYKVSGAK